MSLNADQTLNRAPADRERGQFSVIAAHDDCAWIASHLAHTDIQVLDIRDIDRRVIQHEASGAAVAIEIAGIGLGSIALSQGSANILADQGTLLHVLAGNLDAPTLDLSAVAEQDRNAALLSWIVIRMAEIGKLILSDAAHLRAALATLRREHDEAMERFEQLEASISRAGTPRRILKLNFAATAAFCRIGGDASGHARGVRQLLPTHGSGLAYIELFAEQLPVGSEIKVQISLYEGGRTAALQTWDVGENDLRDGAFPLFLDRALISRERDLTLTISWTGSPEGSMALRLGSPMALDEYCGTLSDGTLVSGPLAIRLWEMPPGTAVAEPEPVLMKDQQGSAPPRVLRRARLALPQSDLERVAKLAPSEYDAGFNIVEFRAGASDILVHPVQDRIVVAVVRNVSWRKIERLSALVQVARTESHPIEFGLAAIAGGQDLDHPERLIQEWTVVEPDHLAEIPGTIDVQPDKAVDLLLATRMHKNASANLAWALFKRIEIVV